MGEFELIARYFTRPTPNAVLGVGDDCALLQPGPGMQMAISTDLLVEGRHFFADVDPRSLGHKALAVNLSDLAACGARPLAFTLALALPKADPAWLEPFSQGLLALADAHGCELIGGDTTQGPLAICITVFGEVPTGGFGRGGARPTQALLRSGAQAGDDVWVSGTLGDAHLALQALQGRIDLPADLLARARQRLERPTPRVALGLALRGLASSAIDVSDGLLGDLGHVLRRSCVGVSLCLDDLPVSPWLATRSPDERLDCILAGGDDYELLFTAPPAQRERVVQLGAELGLVLSRIGQIEAEPGLRLWRGASAVAEPAEGREAVPNRWTSFDHFKGAA